VKLVKSVDESDFVRGLREEARQHQLPIQVGVHEPGDSANKVKNTLLWIDHNGDILQRYQKVHLFDVDIKGGPVLKESEYVSTFPGPY
jgi:predicted amidohydrolase